MSKSIEADVKCMSIFDKNYLLLPLPFFTFLSSMWKLSMGDKKINYIRKWPFRSLLSIAFELLILLLLLCFCMAQESTRQRLKKYIKKWRTTMFKVKIPRHKMFKLKLRRHKMFKVKVQRHLLLRFKNKQDVIYSAFNCFNCNCFLIMDV